LSEILYLTEKRINRKDKAKSEISQFYLKIELIYQNYCV